MVPNHSKLTALCIYNFRITILTIIFDCHISIWKEVAYTIIPNNVEIFVKCFQIFYYHSCSTYHTVRYTFFSPKELINLLTKKVKWKIKMLNTDLRKQIFFYYSVFTFKLGVLYQISFFTT